MSRKRIIYIILGLILAGIAGCNIYDQVRLNYSYTPAKLPDSFEVYHEINLTQSDDKLVRPGNEEKLIRYSDKTDIALLYIHGFTASRAEGEYVVDSLAELFQANTYYLRLPGHGQPPDSLDEYGYKDYLDRANDALQMVQQLGDKVVVVGTSMGGMIATYLAATQPDKVDGLVLSSPFYDYSNAMGNLIQIPGVIGIMKLIDGPYREPAGSKAWQAKKKEGYEDYWTRRQPYEALAVLDDLRRVCARKKYYKQVQCPTLLLYYYKNEEQQDGAASVDAMLKAFDLFKGKKEKVAVADGEHVLMSEYIQTDKALVLAESKEFLETIE